MNHNYKCIRDRITDPILWWDERAVPRYDPFSPERVANIYACQAALVEISCQSCGYIFSVAFSWEYPDDPETLMANLHYGDPPNIGCCPAGPSMSARTRRVLEFWTHT